MSAVFNLVVIGMVLLIAYWWANQGLFSAILHLVCVVAAGAIALAIWEPLVTGLLLHNSFFDNYAWGLGLVVPFTVILLALRVIFDKSVANNVTLPRWADLTFGLGVGALAGILTTGIFVIGCGFVQSHREIMGFTGYARSKESKGTVMQLQTMWLPVHTLTSEFYSMISAGSLYPTFNDTPMRRLYPDLDKVAVALQRDSFNNGRGGTTLPPKEASVGRVYSCDTCNPKRLAVEMTFEGGARDFGEQLTLSASQIRLIGRATGMTKARVVHPIEFTQYNNGHFRFDDISHYITSEPAQLKAVATIEFDITDLGNQVPEYIQVKGTRFRLPKPGTPQWQTMNTGAYRTAVGSTNSAPMGKVEISPNGIDISNAVVQTREIRPITVSINQLPSGVQTIKVDEKNWISGGDGEFMTVNPNRPGRGLEISGILQPPGTSLVQVDVSRSSPASIFKESLESLAGSNDPLVMLVDTQGRPYYPIGYMWQQPNGRTRVMVNFGSPLDKRSKLPSLPTSDTHKLKLIFMITNGSTVAGLKLGEAVVGTCNKLVDDPDKLRSLQNNEGGGGEVGIGP